MARELIGKPSTFRLTRKLAKEFAEMEKVPRDRPMSDKRLKAYKLIAEKGEFRPLTWAKAVVNETGRLYRVNGKHTSTLFASIEQLPDLYVCVEEWRCDTMEDLARLYSTYDSRMASRNTTDINVSFAGIVPGLEEVNARTVGWVVSGIAYYANEDQYAKVPPEERAEALLDPGVVDFAVFLRDMLQPSEHTADTGITAERKLGRVPVVAAMYGSYLKSRTAAVEFWSAVRDETCRTHTTPTRLANYLKLNVVNKGGGAKATRKASNREFFVKCIHAWNAYRKVLPSDLKYFPDAKTPAFL